VTSYKTGVRTRFLLDDLRTLPGNLKQPGKRLSFLKDFFKFKNVYYDDISLDDPLPFLALFASSGKRILS
jgi:hypothetical protein